MTSSKPITTRMPSLFVAHGSPLLLEDSDWSEALNAWANALPKPKSILMVSAHWIEPKLGIGATTPAPLVYDFFGFPDRFYKQTYASPPAPALAQRVRELVSGKVAIAEFSDRGLDHGAYVPLVAMYPEADVPVLQIALPGLDPQDLFDLGRTLAPLRDEGVLIVGSGFLSHDLGLLGKYHGSRAPQWAVEFDAWMAEAIARKDVDALIDYRRQAPHVSLALPTHEHFAPLLVALGAASEQGAAAFPITGFTHGAMTKRSVQFD